MPTTTLRDKIWNHALLKTQRQGEPVYPKDLADELDCSYPPVSETLNFMAGNGWLIREKAPSGRVRYLPIDGFTS